MTTDIENVKESYLRCTENENFIPNFYDIFLNKDPEIKKMFAGVDFKLQYDLLKRGIMSMISFLSEDGGIAGKVTFRLRQTHSKEGMNIKTHHYLLWKESLLSTLKNIDPAWNDNIEKSWSSVIDKGIVEMSRDN